MLSLSLTFTEYETLLDTDSQSIMEIAEHLIYWRKAKLIDTISLKSIYGPIRPSQPGAPKLQVAGYTLTDTKLLTRYLPFLTVADWLSGALTLAWLFRICHLSPLFLPRCLRHSLLSRSSRRVAGVARTTSKLLPGSCKKVWSHSFACT